MKIDLCKLFGVEEGEEFNIEGFGIKYRIYNNRLECYDANFKEWIYSTLGFNKLIASEIIKLQKKKEFTDNELFILKNIDKKYKWIAKDKNGLIVTFVSKPIKTERFWNDDVPYASLEAIKNSLFNSIQWEDDEPVCIDDYVTRNKGDE